MSQKIITYRLYLIRLLLLHFLHIIRDSREFLPSRCLARTILFIEHVTLNASYTKPKKITKTQWQFATTLLISLQLISMHFRGKKPLEDQVLVLAHVRSTPNSPTTLTYAYFILRWWFEEKDLPRGERSGKWKCQMPAVQNHYTKRAAPTSRRAPLYRWNACATRVGFLNSAYLCPY